MLGHNSYGSGSYQGYRGLRFRPLAPLEPGETYQVTVSGVENLSGVPMEEPYGWSFGIDEGATINSYVSPKKTLYYYFNGQRVAMRQIDEFEQVVLYWLIGDRLGTTSLVLCGQQGGCEDPSGGGVIPEGSVVAESRHYPYGQVRWSDGTLPTDYRFTGQRDDAWGCIIWGRGFTTLILTNGSSLILLYQILPIRKV